MTLPVTVADALRAWDATVAVVAIERIQSLWSGYGELLRLGVQSPGGDLSSLIVKWIRLGAAAGELRQHPRGWAGAQGHLRKVRSYEVEVAWYRQYAERCDESVLVPACMFVHNAGDETVLVLQDLDASGLDHRRHYLSDNGITACLRWLAHFHAEFFNQSPDDLWPQGTYWHLATRPDELASMAPGPLRTAASQLDSMLASCPYRTLVHGDAKVANFCFSADEREVGAVDFQYVGGGIGVQDVIYFLGSVLDAEACRRQAETFAEAYFVFLAEALAARQPQVAAVAVVAAWRRLYPVAWADFERFLAGWCPGHPKQHAYSQQQTDRALQLIDEKR